MNDSTELKRPNCWPWLIGGLIGLALLGCLAAYTGDSSAKKLEAIGQDVAQQSLEESQYIFAKAELDGAVLRIKGDAPSAEVRLAACAKARDGLKSRHMLGLPGLAARVSCELTVNGANVSPLPSLPKPPAAAPATPAAAPASGPSAIVANNPAAQNCQTQLNTAASSGPVNFRKNHAEILSGTATLDQIANVAKSCTGFHIEVGGHTDAQGPAELNLRLSQNRAEAVMAYLVSHGVAQSQLSAKGYGATQLLDEGHSSAAHAKNRRTEFKITAAQ